MHKNTLNSPLISITVFIAMIAIMILPLNGLAKSVDPHAGHDHASHADESMEELFEIDDHEGHGHDGDYSGHADEMLEHHDDEDKDDCATACASDHDVDHDVDHAIERADDHEGHGHDDDHSGHAEIELEHHDDDEDDCATACASDHEVEAEDDHAGHGHAADPDAFCREHNMLEREDALCQAGHITDLNCGDGMLVRLFDTDVAAKTGIATAHPVAAVRGTGKTFPGQVAFNRNRLAKITPLSSGVDAREPHAPHHYLTG